ncbi:MAG: vWA domain-containing protein [Acidimicrobiales bacterium]
MKVAAAFGERLRQAGLAMSPDRVARFVGAVEIRRPSTVTDLYWTALAVFVGSPGDIPVFDRAFDRVFGGGTDPAEGRGDPNAPGVQPTLRSGAGQPPPPPGRAGRPPIPGGSQSDPEREPAPAGPPGAGGSDDGSGRPALLAAASRQERLATTDFAELSGEELAELYALMGSVRMALPTRASRRRRRHRHGDRLDLRATLRRSRRVGGEPFERVTRRTRERPRRLVVLCDISGSMAPYSRAFIQLLHAARGATGAEVFVFATRLTRVTRALEEVRPDVALARAAAAAPDWQGGTRIGDAIKTFLDGYGRRGLARGAVVVVVSDGWDRSQPERVAEQMARLSRLAYRVVWVNPRSAAPGFAPLAGGMAAALPFCDALVAGNTVAALRDAAPALAGAGDRTATRRRPIRGRAPGPRPGPPGT